MREQLCFQNSYRAAPFETDCKLRFYMPNVRLPSCGCLLTFKFGIECVLKSNFSTELLKVLEFLKASESSVQ